MCVLRSAEIHVRMLNLCVDCQVLCSCKSFLKYALHHATKISFRPTHRKIPVAENGDDACNPTNQYGPPRLNDHISHRSNGNTPGQGRVLYVNLRTP